MNNATKKLGIMWIRKYILRTAAICLGVAFLLWIGERICFAIHPVWHSTDRYYYILKYISDNEFEFGIVVVMLVVFFTTILEMVHISNVIGKITDGVKVIYSGKDEQIDLPKDFKEIEIGLRQIQLDTRTSAQEAHDAEQRKNDMIMYMAHDLKTPLTSVIGYLTLVDEEKELPDTAREKYISIALKKSLRLEELINGFFDITRYNFTHMVLEKTTVNMGMMLSQIIAEFEPVFKEKELAVNLDIQNNIMVTCDIEKMERVYDNLFKNIANYSYRNTEIIVSLTKDGDRGMKLLTINKGKTIPQEKLDHIFEQFFRIDSSRNSESGGSGLGLAVTKEIVELHGGLIRCRSENEEIIFELVIS